MNIAEYFNKLNCKSQEIFQNTLGYQDELGKTHHYASCIFEFAEHLSDSSEKQILVTVSSQLETSCLNASFGMYRQSLSSLRLALEMGLAAVYFSAHKLELHEWLNGCADIKWANLIDENNGVLSKRFANAFSSELAEDALKYRSQAIEAYRELSEFVHGNHETWESSGLTLEYNQALLLRFFELYKTVSEIILFTLSCRHLNWLSQKSVDSLDFLNEELGHVPAIRQKLSCAKG